MYPGFWTLNRRQTYRIRLIWSLLLSAVDTNWNVTCRGAKFLIKSTVRPYPHVIRCHLYLLNMENAHSSIAIHFPVMSIQKSTVPRSYFRSPFSSSSWLNGLIHCQMDGGQTLSLADILNFSVRFGAFCGAFWLRISIHQRQLKWQPFRDLVYPKDLVILHLTTNIINDVIISESGNPLFRTGDIHNWVRDVRPKGDSQSKNWGFKHPLSLLSPFRPIPFPIWFFHTTNTFLLSKSKFQLQTSRKILRPTNDRRPIFRGLNNSISTDSLSYEEIYRDYNCVS